MKKELKDKWVAALRSGQYKQCQGRLCRRDFHNKPVGYCCLGVLCEVAELKKTPGDNGYTYYHDNTFRSATDLPFEFGKQIGIGIEDHLMQMNDSGYSFDEIADHIENNITGE